MQNWVSQVGQAFFDAAGRRVNPTWIPPTPPPPPPPQVQRAAARIIRAVLGR